MFRYHRQASVASVSSCLILLLFAVSASAATRYVWQGSSSPAPPYDSWANAATNIQDAVDVAAPGDTVLVTNGVYGTGGRAARALASALVTPVAGSGRVLPITDQQNAGHIYNAPKYLVINHTNSQHLTAGSVISKSLRDPSSDL